MTLSLPSDRPLGSRGIQEMHADKQSPIQGVMMDRPNSHYPALPSQTIAATEVITPAYRPVRTVTLADRVEALERQLQEQADRLRRLEERDAEDDGR